MKLAGKLAEEGKVALRNIRRDGVEAIRKQEKNHEISEDEARNLQNEIQKITDQYITKVEELLAAKEKDITSN